MFVFVVLRSLTTSIRMGRTTRAQMSMEMKIYSLARVVKTRWSR